VTAKISQAVLQVETSAETLGWTKVSQAVLQVEVVATSLGWTKVSQAVLQVEVDPPKVFADTLGLDDSVEGYVETPRSFSDGIGLTDAFTGFRYTNYQNMIDNPHVGPVRIAKIELPGKTLYLCDRLWGGA